MESKAKNQSLASAISLAHFLGRPELKLAILAEGNTSAKINQESFWIKASGQEMRTIGEDGFLQVQFEPILKALDPGATDDADVKTLLSTSRLSKTDQMPSVETFMHAYLLTLPGVSLVAHCHPTTMLSLLCLKEAHEISQKRIFPDEIVCCGPAAAFVPYLDPGLPLARGIKNSVQAYMGEFGTTPKTIWLANHGLICLGASVRELESATLMSEKAATVWLGALTTGKPLRELSESDIARIHTRPDEHYRQKLLWQAK